MKLSQKEQKDMLGFDVALKLCLGLEATRIGFVCSMKCGVSSSFPCRNLFRYTLGSKTTSIIYLAFMYERVWFRCCGLQSWFQTLFSVPFCLFIVAPMSWQIQPDSQHQPVPPLFRKILLVLPTSACILESCLFLQNLDGI